MKTPHTQPILLVSARPGPVHGTYEGQIIVHAQDLATSKSLASEALHNEHCDTEEPYSFVYRKDEISKRDPYKATTTIRFTNMSKLTLDALRKSANASYLARSRSATSRDLSNAILERSPLHVPSRDMWSAALSAKQGFGEKPPMWLIESVFMGHQEPNPLVSDVAHKLLDEENARRRKMR